METTQFGIGHNQPPIDCPISRQRWPKDAVARIYRPSRSVTTSGRARTRKWVLCFERRTPPFIEPLMGWTGGDDTLAQVELTFDTLDQAIRYAQQEGVPYRVEGEGLASARTERREGRQQHQAAERLYTAAAALASMDPRYGVAAVGRRPDIDRALVNPAAVFTSPQEVVHDPSLTFDDKREVLRRWAWDAWLLETAADEAMTQGEPSRLDEVKAALCALERAERTPVLVMAQTDTGGVPLAA